MRQKDLLGLYELSAGEIDRILTLGLSMKRRLLARSQTSETTERPRFPQTAVKPHPELSQTEIGIHDALREDDGIPRALEGKTVALLFYENSTRTRCSFELAAKRMGAHVLNISADASSVRKGESLADTGRTLDAMQCAAIVIRHPMGGAPKLLGGAVKAHVVNAGDGMNEHPTQALLDLLTMRERWGSFSGKKVAILGDIRHSRVAKSDLYGLTKMGAEVRMFAPRTLLPSGLDRLGAKICSSREEAVEGADAVMGLRVQLERQRAGNFPSLGEYAAYYGLNDEILKYAKRGAILMHPGPVNRGVELSSAVIDGENSVIGDQVLSGVAVRMAVLSLLTEERS